MRANHLLVLVSMIVGLAPAAALAQERSNSVGGFGAFTLNDASSSRTAFGGSVAFDLTPNIQAIGEVGRIGDVLPSTTSRLLDFTPFDVRLSAFYGEGGVRFLASPGSSVTPYAEASAGIARLHTGVAGFDSPIGAIVGGALAFLDQTEPIAGVGGGVMFRSGPVLVDVGYRYKQIFANDALASALSLGRGIRSNQVRVGVGFRF